MTSETNCPHCGKPIGAGLAGCDCGYSYYPRTPVSPLRHGLKPMTPEERQLMRANAGRFMGIVSIPAMMGGPYGMVAGALAIILSASVLKTSFAKVGRFGLVCGIIGLLLSAWSTAYIVVNPGLLR